MSERNLNENILNDEELEAVSGGVVKSSGTTDKKGFRTRAKVKYTLLSSSAETVASAILVQDGETVC